MRLLQNFLKKGTNLITIVGIILVFAIVLNGTDAMYILIILGILNIFYGLNALVNKKGMGKNQELLEGPDANRYYRIMGIYQIGTGAFIMAMGIIYINKIITGRYFWDVVLAGLVIFLVLWYIAKLKARNVK